jgi:hypothetical protein
MGSRSVGGNLEGHGAREHGGAQVLMDMGRHREGAHTGDRPCVASVNALVRQIRR